MPTYEVVAPCAYARDGRLVRHHRPGAVVELDEVTAALLGSKVVPIVPKRRPRESKTPPAKPVSPPSPPPSSGGDTVPPELIKNNLAAQYAIETQAAAELEVPTDGE